MYKNNEYVYHIPLSFWKKKIKIKKLEYHFKIYYNFDFQIYSIVFMFQRSILGQFGYKLGRIFNCFTSNLNSSYFKFLSFRFTWYLGFVPLIKFSCFRLKWIWIWIWINRLDQRLFLFSLGSLLIIA